MIAFLKGNFVIKTPALVHVDVNGVGYEVQISLNTYSKIQDLEKGICLLISILREDAHILYGFFEAAEKEMFLQLISVSGVGAVYCPNDAVFHETGRYQQGHCAGKYQPAGKHQRHRKKSAERISIGTER